jgi:hypothetical protein
MAAVCTFEIKVTLTPLNTNSEAFWGKKFKKCEILVNIIIYRIRVTTWWSCGIYYICLNSVSNEQL